MVVATILIECFGEGKYATLLNVFIGVLGSSVVTLVISIADYIVAKRDALEDYFNQIYKIIVAFNKIKYIDIDERVYESAKYKNGVYMEKLFDAKRTDMDEILEYYTKQHYFDMHPQDLTIDEKKEIISVQVDKDISKILKAMKSYLTFEDISYEDVENAYRRISFFTDAPKWSGKLNKYRVWLYETFHENLRNMIRIIRLENYHFKLYEEQEANNLLVITRKIDELNERFFVKKEEKGIITVFSAYFNDMMDNLEEFRSRIYKCEKKMRMRAPIYTKIGE